MKPSLVAPNNRCEYVPPVRQSRCAAPGVERLNERGRTHWYCPEHAEARRVFWAECEARVVAARAAQDAFDAECDRVRLLGVHLGFQNVTAQRDELDPDKLTGYAVVRVADLERLAAKVSDVVAELSKEV